MAGAKAAVVASIATAIPTVCSLKFNTSSQPFVLFFALKFMDFQKTRDY